VLQCVRFLCHGINVDINYGYQRMMVVLAFQVILKHVLNCFPRCDTSEAVCTMLMKKRIEVCAAGIRTSDIIVSLA